MCGTQWHHRSSTVSACSSSGKNRTRCSMSRQMILWHIELHVLTECGVRSLMTAGAENQSHLLNEDGHRLAVCPHEQWRQS